MMLVMPMMMFVFPLIIVIICPRRRGRNASNHQGGEQRRDQFSRPGFGVSE
jgi:hypothetical protein